MRGEGIVPIMDVGNNGNGFGGFGGDGAWQKSAKDKSRY